MLLQRSAGILLHPTPLPARGGIGDLGPEAYAFADFLAEAQQSIWQVLPLSPPGLGNSPYSAISAFAGNPLLISLEPLADRGWISQDRLPGFPSSPRLDFDQVKPYKFPHLPQSAPNFLQTPHPHPPR